ncbi:hypothetical protein MSG28_013942 [Choristoneura fumiferana]|uniref:Uncharacterized protein n=1 Tax=Choristoneura fumiferana TaxID=7141 RepID=A0ACC0K9F4_CHOFU|nr:hypothetical protein MSG28_013942 [Choristoneura fumiferana]
MSSTATLYADEYAFVAAKAVEGALFIHRGGKEAAVPLSVQAIIDCSWGSESIGVLGVDISSNVQFCDHVENKAKIAAKKLGFSIVQSDTSNRAIAHSSTRLRFVLTSSIALTFGLEYQLLPLDLLQGDPILSGKLDLETTRHKGGFQPHHLDDWCSSDVRFNVPFYLARVKHGMDSLLGFLHLAMIWVPSKGECIAYCKAGKAAVSMGGGDHLPSGDQLLVCQLFDKKMPCSRFGNRGNDGGSAEAAFEWMMKHGLPTDAAYPFKNEVTRRLAAILGKGLPIQRGNAASLLGTKNSNDSCYIDNVEIETKVKGYYKVPSNDVNALKLAIVNHGPVVVMFDHMNMFYSYGIYNETGKCLNDPGSGNRQGLVIGYGSADDQEYWILMIDNGIVQIVTRDNTCGVMNAPIYVTYDRRWNYRHKTFDVKPNIDARKLCRAARLAAPPFSGSLPMRRTDDLVKAAGSRNWRSVREAYVQQWTSYG